MGLFGDIKSRVILEYKADTEQAKQKLRELTGEQKKQAQAAVQGIEDQIKAHETLAGKITLGVGIAAGAIAIGIQGFKKYEEATRLSAATAGVSMDKLRTASHGLLTDMELMGVAAQGMNGRFALSSNEMETVLGAAVQLQRQGLMPLGEAAQKLGEAVKKGEIDPLKELGIAYDENLARTDKKAAALKALSSLSQQAAGTYQTETEAIQAHGKAFEDSIDRINIAIGALVAKLEPLLNITAELLGLIAGKPGKYGTAALNMLDNREQRAKWAKEDRDFWHSVGVGSDSEYDTFGQMFRSLGLGAPITVENMPAGYMPPKPGQARRGRGKRKTPESYLKRGLDYLADFAPEPGTYEYELAQTYIAQQLNPNAGLNFGPLGTGASDALAASASPYGALSGIGGANADALAAMMGTEYAKQPTITERLFGTPEEIDGYRTAWSGLTDTMLAGYDAMVSGSESVGSAMKKALGGAIQATGRKMFIRSLEETAEGVAALFLNPAAAGQHFAAAALFGAGSVAAGVAARELGAGGSTGGGVSRSAGASASGVGLGGGAMQPAPINRTFIIGDSYADEDPRTQRRRFGERIRRARATESDAEGTRYS